MNSSKNFQSLQYLQHFQELENLKLNEPMHRHTTLKVGGTATIYFKPENQSQLSDFLSLNHQQSQPNDLLIIGLGSNLIIRDGGFDGAIISTKALNNIALSEADDHQPSIWAECGTGCAKLAQKANKLGYDNLNFLVGVPGSIGGALAMNAGCHCQQTWENIIQVEWMDETGNLMVLNKNQFNIQYRKVIAPKKGMFYRALFALKQENRPPISYFLNWRKNHQPIDRPNCGSVFKNPNPTKNNQVSKVETLSAGALIEKAGLKGRQIGGAAISQLHANFIVNLGGATAKDVEDLIHLIGQTIKTKFDINLETEVVMMGIATKDNDN